MDARIKEQKALERLGLTAASSEILLRDFVTDVWWERYALAVYADNTRRSRASAWNSQINPFIGGVQLADLSVATLEEWQAQLRAKGLADNTRMNALMLLSAIIKSAVKWGYMPANPVPQVDKPRTVRYKEVRVLPPATVEALRALLPGRGAMAVSLTAYAGLRPREARGLRWEHVQRRTIHVPGEITKTKRARSIRLWAPLRDDLDAWRETQEHPGPILGWTENQYNHWRRDTFSAACNELGLEGTRFYDLRHSYVSLLIQSGANIIDIARQAGHRPTETLQTYGHLFDEYDPAHRIDPEEELVSVRCPPTPETA